MFQWMIFFHIINMDRKKLANGYFITIFITRVDPLMKPLDLIAKSCQDLSIHGSRGRNQESCHDDLTEAATYFMKIFAVSPKTL